MTDAFSPTARDRATLRAIPELARPVGMFGTLRRTEVGGSICFGVAVAMSTYAND